VAYYDERQKALRTDDIDYILGEDNKQIGGVLYPDYANADYVDVQVEWDPTVYAISDGRQTELALVRPQVYGASPEESIYSVQGIYTFAASGERRYAVMQFLGDQLRDVLGYSDTKGTGAVRKILPQVGDTFTILEQWLAVDSSGARQSLAREGGTLTFGRERFTWQEMQPESGQYAIGVLVEDLDGNMSEQFAAVAVQ
jgi:hypothetical protein